MVIMLVRNGWRGRVVAEPNLTSAVLDHHIAKKYKQEVERVKYEILGDSCVGFEVVYTIQITEQTTPAMIYAACAAGIRVAKVYPRNVTTNSKNGVVDYWNIIEALKAARDCGMIVQFHCEHPSEEIEGMHKEARFIEILGMILREVPGLKIVVEHISSAIMVKWVREAPPNVAASVAPQHAILTIDDVIGYSPRSNFKGETQHMCKPTLKMREDRQAIQDAITSGSPKFFYGGDDAAHSRFDKGAIACNCGDFNTSVGIPAMLELFIGLGKLEMLDDFMSGFGADFYGYPRNTSFLVYEQKEWQVPLLYKIDGAEDMSPAANQDGVVPMLAGHTMQYQILS